MQQHQYVLFGVLLISSILRIEGITTTAKPEPVITYNCDAKKVTTFDISGDSFDHLRLFKDGKFCEPNSPNEQGVLECITTLQTNQPLDTNITLLYEESTHQGTIGGKITKFYLINCDEKSTKKTAVAAHLDVKPSKFPLTKLGLDISVDPSLSIKESSAGVYVGMQITLQMKIDVKYKLLPTSCSAYKNDNDKIGYTFWTKCDNNNDKAIIPNLMWKAVDGTVDHKTIVAIGMYAFRFTDQPVVIIKCETWVCPTGTTTECDQSSCPHQGVGRKRRNTNDTMKKNTNVTTATASVALEVFEGIEFRENGSNALSPLWYIYAGGIGIIYWITLKNF